MDDISRTYSIEIGLIVVASIIFIISFIWKDFLLQLEGLFFPYKPSIVQRLIYYIIVTLILLFALILIRNYLNRVAGITHPLLAKP